MSAMPRSPLRPGALTGKPFRASAAIRDGLLTKAQVRSSAWRRLFRDVYVDARTPDSHATRVAGAVLLLPPGAVIAGRSAASTWGVKQPDPPDQIEVATPGAFGPVRGLIVYTGSIAPDEMAVFRGVPVTTPAHTAWDLARRLPRLEAVTWIDSLAHQRAIGRDQLTRHKDRHGRQSGSRRAADTLELCDPRAESPPESILRLHLHLAGVPVVPQHWVMNNGEAVARADLALPEIKLAIEYDGQWHADHHQLSRDRKRLRGINQSGWHVYSVTKEDMHNMEKLVRNIKEVIGAIKRSRG